MGGCNTKGYVGNFYIITFFLGENCFFHKGRIENAEWAKNWKKNGSIVKIKVLFQNHQKSKNFNSL